MLVNRGDVVLAFVDFVGSPGGKVRPNFVVQTDTNNHRLNETIVAVITSNLSHTHEPTQFLINVATPDGAATGLLFDSAVRCERLHTIPQSDLQKIIGSLSDPLMAKIDECLKAALGIS
jgi:mRNA interferase MazF